MCSARQVIDCLRDNTQYETQVHHVQVLYQSVRSKRALTLCLTGRPCMNEKGGEDESSLPGCVVALSGRAKWMCSTCCVLVMSLFTTDSHVE